MNTLGPMSRLCVKMSLGAIPMAPPLSLQGVEGRAGSWFPCLSPLMFHSQLHSSSVPFPPLRLFNVCFQLISPIKYMHVGVRELPGVGGCQAAGSPDPFFKGGASDSETTSSTRTG